jgi:protein-S-isoprenylcysteine O-methyltransferase Ste14
MSHVSVCPEEYSHINALWILLLVVPVLVVIRYGVIAREEAYLTRKFGDAYRQYTAQVRRWL